MISLDVLNAAVRPIVTLMVVVSLCLAFLVGVYFGMPRMGNSMRLLEGIIREQGRMAELGNPPNPEAKKK